MVSYKVFVSSILEEKRKVLLYTIAARKAEVESDSIIKPLFYPC